MREKNVWANSNNIIFVILSVLLFAAPIFSQNSNPSSISGSIELPNEVFQSLSRQHGSNLLTSGIKFEVWKVVYRDVLVKDGKGSKKNQTRIYFNEKTDAAVTSSINKSGDKQNINFIVKNIPQSGDYVLLYYFTKTPSQYKVFKAGSKVNDGTGRANRNLASNIRLKIGSDTQYGIISILPQPSPQNYKTQVFASTNGNMSFSLWGDILDFISDVAQAVFEGGEILAGVFVNAVGGIFIQVGTVVYNVIVYGTIPHFRVLSEAELSWANEKIFNGTLPPRRTMFITNLLGIGGRAFVIPNGLGQIYMNLGEIYNNPTAPAAGRLFIHELTHAWQIEHNPSLKSFAEAVANQWNYTVLGDQSVYDYGDACGGKPWAEYNYEQQASIVAAAYSKRENSEFNSCEENYVVANIRNNSPFPPVRTPECLDLLNRINAKQQELNNRINYLKSRKAIELADKLGRPVAPSSIQLSDTELMQDSVYRTLKAELDTLVRRKPAICRQTVLLKSS